MTNIILVNTKGVVLVVFNKEDYMKKAKSCQTKGEHIGPSQLIQASGRESINKLTQNNQKRRWHK